MVSNESMSTSITLRTYRAHLHHQSHFPHHAVLFTGITDLAPLPIKPSPEAVNYASPQQFLHLLSSLFSISLSDAFPS